MTEARFPRTAHDAATADPAPLTSAGLAPIPSSHDERAKAIETPRTVKFYERLTKPLIDRFTGLILVILTLPAQLIIAVGVLISLRWPIIMREERIGRNGKVFRMLRFRTARVAEDSDDRQLEERMTRFGRFLRRWSLDELPQLWNLLLGDMSLVGPRPERPQLVANYTPSEHRRHQVKPGATGLWQVLARGDGRHMHENVDIDLDYVDQISFLTDLRILLMTVPVVLHRPEKPTAIPGVLDTPKLRPRRWSDVAYLTTKRLTDLVGSLVVIVLAFPLFLIIAVAIKIDSRGPLFFRQTRVGYRGRLFRMLKFRTMIHNADEDFHRDHYETVAGDADTPIEIADDPRVTRVGRLLRKWSLDEVPNFWNVMKGEMSLIGPRPIVPYEVDLYDPQEWERLEARPGVSGLAQIQGRSNLSMRGRIQYDLEYVDKRSPWLDTKILLRTPAALIRNRGD